MDYTVHGILQASSGVGCHALLQGIFPTQGSNPDLLHCRGILYQLSHQGKPRISPVDLPNPGIELGSPAFQEESLPTELSVQFSSVAQSCPTLRDPMNHSTPGFPVHHQLPESPAHNTPQFTYP